MARELKNLLVNRLHDRELERVARAYVRGRLIDIGCGTKPYEALLAPYVAEHVGVDHAHTPHDPSRIDIVASAYDIPVEDESFDTVLCTSVLEHLEEPAAALRESHRILRPGGIAVYSVPFIWHLHEEPRDFYRFSKYGLAYLFDKVEFEICELKALSSFWVTFGQLLVYNLYRANRRPLSWIPVIPALGVMVQAGAYALDRLDRNEKWTWAYLVVARRSAKGASRRRDSLHTCRRRVDDDSGPVLPTPSTSGSAARLPGGTHGVRGG